MSQRNWGILTALAVVVILVCGGFAVLDNERQASSIIYLCGTVTGEDGIPQKASVSVENYLILVSHGPVRFNFKRQDTPCK